MNANEIIDRSSEELTEAFDSLTTEGEGEIQVSLDQDDDTLVWYWEISSSTWRTRRDGSLVKVRAWRVSPDYEWDEWIEKVQMALSALLEELEEEEEEEE